MGNQKSGEVEAPEPPPAIPDPLLGSAAISEDQRAYLGILGEVGMPYLAVKRARAKGVQVSVGVLRKWREDPTFADLYETIRRGYWDEQAQQNIDLARVAKVTGGAANLLMQQLNRAIPDEYLTPVVTQNFQTTIYQAEGEFKEPERKPEEKVEIPSVPPVPEKTH